MKQIFIVLFFSVFTSGYASSEQKMDREREHDATKMQRIIETLFKCPELPKLAKRVVIKGSRSNIHHLNVYSGCSLTDEQLKLLGKMEARNVQAHVTIES